MKVISKRCKHCKTVYSYQMSGHGDYTYNNDTYCPDCYKVILESLKSVDVKFEKIKLPSTDMSVEEFEKRYEEYKKQIENSQYGLMAYRVCYGSPENFNYKDLTIDNVDYTLITNTDTNEKLLEVEYEQNIKTKELTGLWYEYR